MPARYDYITRYALCILNAVASEKCRFTLFFITFLPDEFQTARRLKMPEFAVTR